MKLVILYSMELKAALLLYCQDVKLATRKAKPCDPEVSVSLINSQSDLTCNRDKLKATASRLEASGMTACTQTGWKNGHLAGASD